MLFPNNSKIKKKNISQLLYNTTIQSLITILKYI